MKSFHDVVVVGLGYIGLPTAVMFANSGLRVLGVEKNPDRIAAIQNGKATADEPQLELLLERSLSCGAFEIGDEPEAAGAYIIAVPTPLSDSGAMDYDLISSAVAELANSLVAGALVILESTVSPGTTKRMADQIRALRPDLIDSDSRLLVDVAHCPERVLPGAIVEEFRTNDRVVGGLTIEAGEKAAQLYSQVTGGQVLVTSAETAELSKLAENAFRDVNIAFANELSNIADSYNIDIWELREIANRHPRVEILRPGPGVGGHCIAVDPWFIISSAPKLTSLMRAARSVNDARPAWVVQKIQKIRSLFNHSRVRVYGATFKANVDDTRESPALSVIDGLAASYPDEIIEVVDPKIETLPETLDHTNIVLLTRDEAASLNPESLHICLVAHNEFKGMLAEIKKSQNFLDIAGLFEKS